MASLRLAMILTPVGLERICAVAGELRGSLRAAAERRGARVVGISNHSRASHRPSQSEYSSRIRSFESAPLDDAGGAIRVARSLAARSSFLRTKPTNGHQSTDDDDDCDVVDQEEHERTTPIE